MKRIEVLHCTGSGTLPKLISFFSSSRITHSAIRINGSDGNNYIYEMQENGCTRKLESSWTKKYGYKYTVTTHDISEFKYAKLLSFEGVLPYDKGTLVVSQLVYQLTGWWVGRKQKSVTDGMICSELVAYVIGMPKWWKQSPKSLYKWCLKNEVR